MKQPIKKQWNLPFDLCRVAKTLGVVLGMLTALGLFILVAATYPMYILYVMLAICTSLGLFAITALVYEMVGPCK